MYRTYMPVNQGMLFDFEYPQKITMWMKNTYIPLDMLFIDNDGVIVSIAANTEPMSTETISSGQEVRAVLEVNANQAETHGIKVGDRVSYGRIKTWR